MTTPSGFTLVELVVMVAILSIGAAVVAPAVLRAPDEPSSGDRAMTRVLHDARLTALRCSCRTKVQFRSATGEWFVTAYPTDGPTRVRAGQPSSVVSIRRPGYPRDPWIAVEFGPFGRPRTVPPRLLVFGTTDTSWIRISPGSGIAHTENP